MSLPPIADSVRRCNVLATPSRSTVSHQNSTHHSASKLAHGPYCWRMNYSLEYIPDLHVYGTPIVGVHCLGRRTITLRIYRSRSQRPDTGSAAACTLTELCYPGYISRRYCRLGWIRTTSPAGERVVSRCIVVKKALVSQTHIHTDLLLSFRQITYLSHGGVRSAYPKKNDQAACFHNAYIDALVGSSEPEFEW